MSAAALVEQPELRTALLRALLLPVHYTALEVKPGDHTVKAGEPFTLEAVISGRPVSEVRWHHRAAGSQKPWDSEPLLPPGQTPETKSAPFSGVLAASLKDCDADLEYRVTAGDVESPTYRLKVIHPLILKSLEARVEPPVYTRKEPSKHKDGDLKVIEGSNVEIRVELDRQPLNAELRLTKETSAGKTKESVPMGIQGASLAGTLAALDRPLEYQVWARADDGMELEPKPYKIRIQRDEKPSIEFVKPAEELAVVATTEVNFEVNASDEFGLGRVGIVYQVNDGPKETLKLDELAGQPLTAELLTTLYLEKHPLNFTDSLTYFAFAEDNKPGSPNRATTDLRYIDILPYRQDYSMSEGEGACNGNSVTLSELIARERVILSRTFSRADDERVDAETVKRLADAQAAVLDATSEFAEGIKQRFGPEPALDEAVNAMQAAGQALGTPDLKRAVPSEESAVSALIRAKKKMRKLLSNSSSAKMCRNFDRQQQQKLRKPPNKDEDKTKVAQDLRKLAEEERKVHDELEPKPTQNQSQSQSNSQNQAQAKSESPSPNSNPAEQQAKAAEAAKALQQAMKNDPSMSQLAKGRMDAAAQTVQEGAEALRSGRDHEAAKRASDAAAQLDRLAEQVEALKAADLAAKLAAAKNLAQGLARQQKDLGDRITHEGSGGNPEAKRRAEAAEERRVVGRDEDPGRPPRKVQDRRRRRVARAEPGAPEGRVEQPPRRDRRDDGPGRRRPRRRPTGRRRPRRRAGRRAARRARSRPRRRPQGVHSAEARRARRPREAGGQGTGSARVGEGRGRQGPRREGRGRPARRGRGGQTRRRRQEPARERRHEAGGRGPQPGRGSRLDELGASQARGPTHLRRPSRLHPGSSGRHRGAPDHHSGRHPQGRPFRA